MDTLEGHGIGIGPLKTGRLVCAVIIYQKMTSRTLLSYPFVEVDHILVLHLHEVYLDSGHSPHSVDIQNVFEICDHRGPKGPQDDSYSL